MKETTVASEAEITSSSNSSFGERWLFAGLLAIVAFAPLPFGSNRPLPMAILSLCSGLLLISWALLWAFKRTSFHAHSNDIKWALFSYGAVCLWIMIQWVPIMPTAFTDPVWQSAAKLLEIDISARLSVNPDATLAGLMRLLAYSGVFWLSFELTRTPERAWFAIRAITWIGTAYAIYGIAVYMTGNDWIVIYPKWTYRDSLTSTFVNRNSYATFAGLTLLAAIAVFTRHMAPFFALKHPLRSKVVLIVEEIIAKGAFKSLSVISIAIALLLSASRGGTGSTAVGLLALAIIYMTRKKLKLSQFFGLLSAVLIAAVIIFSASGNHLSKRLPDDQVQSSLEVRTDIYALTWNAILTSPWKGTGFGTFEDVFPAYRQGNDSPLILWDKAHDTYLENALELGLPAAVLLNLSIALVAFQCLRGALTRKRDKIIPALGVAATVLVGLHSLVDFSLQIPAVSILYACLMGIAVSQSWSQRKA
ncbi:MAG: O-antigen ligase family protein [Parvibaculum sp.]